LGYIVAMTEPEALQQVRRTYVRWRGRALSYFGGCDYFRLASHPRVKAAWQTGLKKFGGNVAASRVTTGNHAVYAELEAALADFFGASAALLVSTGYMANSVAAQGLRGSFSRVLLDGKAHGSLQDAAPQFRCLIQPFKHADAADLAATLARTGAQNRPVLLTEGLFGQNGEIAPLDAYLRAMPAHGVVLLDDAHAAGVLGARGRGTPEHTGAGRERFIQTITLSKAFGVYGGAILTTRAWRQRIIESSLMFAGSTPLPPPLAYAALTALGLLRTDAGLRGRLEANVQHVKGRLLERGANVPNTPAPIIAWETSSPTMARTVRRRLLAAGVYPSFIHYQGGPAAGYFRFAISSEHTRQQLDDLLRALAGPTGS
jgi:7-keto-8-aminopelargonate synthetase-like enzyme